MSTSRIKKVNIGRKNIKKMHAPQRSVHCYNVKYIVKDYI